MSFEIKQGSLLPSFYATIVEVGVGVVDLTGATVTFKMKNASGTVVINAAPMVVTSPTSGVARYDWQAGDVANAGTFSAEITVTFSNGKPLKIPDDDYFTIFVTPSL